MVQDSCILSTNQTNSTRFHSVHGEKIPHKCRRVVETTHAKLVHPVARNWPIIIKTSLAELPNPVYVTVFKNQTPSQHVPKTQCYHIAKFLGH